MPPQLLPIPSGYLTRGGRAHLILHPPKDILKVFHWAIIMQPLIRHAVEGLYDSQCAKTISVNLGQIKFSQIPWTNLTEEASIWTILIKYKEHGSHMIVVLEHHLGKLNASIWVDRRKSILNIVHPSCVTVVEITINLIQLIFQAIQCNINAEPKRTRFYPF